MGMLRRNARRIQRRAERRLFDHAARALVPVVIAGAVPAGALAWKAVQDTPAKVAETVRGIPGAVAPTTPPLPPGGPYKREYFQPNGWEDLDRNGCNTRIDILRRDSAPAITTPGCSIAGGNWPLVYITGVTTDPTQIDIDHIVPLSYAWSNGASGWQDPAGHLDVLRLHEFANDPANLWAVDASENRRKGDAGPAAYQPPARDVWCAYGQRFQAVLTKYNLAVPPTDLEMLGNLTSTCTHG